jgi:hypothetical protein
MYRRAASQYEPLCVTLHARYPGILQSLLTQLEEKERKELRNIIQIAQQATHQFIN